MFSFLFFVVGASVCLAQRTEYLLDNDWKFSLFSHELDAGMTRAAAAIAGPVVPLPAQTLELKQSDDCQSLFPIDLNGKQCMGLVEDSSAKNLNDCLSACCEDDDCQGITILSFVL